jgi:hypothetical protein
MKALIRLVAAVAIAAGALLTVTAPVQAQEVVSEGEKPLGGLACFYECKEGYLPTWWQEVTTLMILNPTNSAITPDLWIFDGNENMLVSSFVELSEFDVDEVNICRTLEANGIVPPSAGMVLMTRYLNAPDDPWASYAYMKNVVGKFFKTVDEPFEGRVTGVGKTECRVVPSEMLSRTPLIEIQNNQTEPPVVELLPNSLIFIEDTGDPLVP